MTDINTVFLSSVQTAVATAVSQAKPLVVYIGAGDSSWIDALMTPQTLQMIEEKAVGLLLAKGSAECAMFEQVFPNAQAPSVFIVRVQQVLDVIQGDVTKEQFEQRLKNVLDAAPQQTPVATPTPTEGHPVAQPQQATTATPPSRPLSTQAPHTSSSPVEPKETPQKKTLKEQTAELMANKYKEEQLRLKRVKIEERERIIRLLKNDEEERKDRVRMERERRQSLKKDEVNDEEGDAAIKELRDQSKMSNYPPGEACALSLRLMDGHSIQQVFKITDTLKDVRTWLDENRTDGTEAYAFHRTIPRVTYETSDEEKTLAALELAPRSALILKPFDSYQESYTSATQGSFMSRVFGGISSFWGSNNGNNPAHGHAITHGDPSVHQVPDFEPYRDTTQDLPPHSPQSSYYASPMHSPLPDLSIGVSHPSALNLDLNVVEPVPQRSRTPLIADQPAPPASLSRMSSNIRTLNDQAVDERDTYNGNQLNLEDDKKKKKKKNKGN